MSAFCQVDKTGKQNGTGLSRRFALRTAMGRACQTLQKFELAILALNGHTVKPSKLMTSNILNEVSIMFGALVLPFQLWRLGAF